MPTRKSPCTYLPPTTCPRASPVLPICLKVLSSITFLAAAGFGVKSELDEKPEGVVADFLLISMGLLGLHFLASTVLSLIRGDNSQPDLMRLVRAGASVCFTTHILTKNQLLPETCDYMPLMVMGTLAIIYFMQGGACGCNDRSYMSSWLVFNLVVQMFSACVTGLVPLVPAAIALNLADVLYEKRFAFSHINNISNVLSAIYCLTARGKIPFLDKDVE